MTTLQWEIQNAAGPVAEMGIFDSIGAEGISVGSFKRDLAGVRARELRLTIHSEGGDALAGLSIHDALVAWPGRVVTLISLAASAASVIALGGDRVLMLPSGSLYIHEPHIAGASGDAAQLRQAADMTDAIGDQIATIYARRAGGTVAEWRATMRLGRWYSAEQAVNAGLADGIEEPAKARPLPAPIMMKLDRASQKTLITAMVNTALADKIGESVARAVRRGALPLLLAVRDSRPPLTSAQRFARYSTTAPGAALVGREHRARR
jgi:ATP-dependent protease ClpP protease subunit